MDRTTALDPANLPDIRTVTPPPIGAKTPHQTKTIFRRHRISGKVLAKATGYNDAYILAVLRGDHRPSPELDRALYIFADQLEPGRFADRLAEFKARETFH